jgi:hypothetical protein
MAKVFYADDDFENWLDYAEWQFNKYNVTLPTGSERLDVVAHHIKDGVIPQQIASIIKNDTYDAIVLDYNWGGRRQELISLVGCVKKDIQNQLLFLVEMIKAILLKPTQILSHLICNMRQKGLTLVSKLSVLLLQKLLPIINNNKFIFLRID